MIRLKWKKAATATDMTEVLRTCRTKGWRVVPTGFLSGGGWLIFTKV